MAEYYMCTEGEVMQAAIPSHLKISSESVFILNEQQEERLERSRQARKGLIKETQMLISSVVNLSYYKKIIEYLIIMSIS
jgi:hypothetical protein